MKFRLLEYLRCPVCRGVLTLDEPVIKEVARTVRCELPSCSGVCPYPAMLRCDRDCDACVRFEVESGVLRCWVCQSRFVVLDGIPRLRVPGTRGDATEVQRTAAGFGFLWSRTIPADVDDPQRFHYAKMERALALELPRGLVLDAGCGEGIDLVDVAGRSGVEVIGVDVSGGGCQSSFERSRTLPNTHVVQADLSRLPFSDETFNVIYSYGVLHHVTVPSRAATELARVGLADARVAVYLYEDFQNRAAGLRWSLGFVNSLRRITTRLPPRILYGLCRAASPLVYLACTVPFLILKRIPPLRRLAFGLPFRHGQGPFRLAGDLYDRFSAPVEHRYSRAAAARLLVQAGLAVTRVSYERGWMVAARKPGEPSSA